MAEEAIDKAANGHGKEEVEDKEGSEDYDQSDDEGDDTFMIDTKSNLQTTKSRVYQKMVDTLVLNLDIRKTAQQREEEKLEATKIESLKMEKEERKRKKAEQRTKHKNEGQTSAAPQAV